MLRRAIDIAAASAALLLLSPLLLAIFIAIRLDSPGSPLYRSWRVGRRGLTFRIWKFRTMVVGADRHGCITGRNDRRVTRLGALLRKTKLDELPQLVNLLLGDMTLVGPRPETPELVALYTPAQCRVLDVKPGLTGQVQLEAGDETEKIPEGADARDYYVCHLMDGKIRRDLEYLQARTPITDARIVARTTVYVAAAIFRPRPIDKKEIA